MSCLRKVGGNIDLRLHDCPLTITKVNISGDLSIANCYFVPFNSNLSYNEILDALEKSKYAIRKFVTANIQLRNSPELRFFYDEAFFEIVKLQSMIGALEQIT